MKNPLLDIDFLNKLHNNRQREVYARITLLNQNEMPIEYIEGRVTAGTVNVDGNSALRRTCNLTMTLKDQSEINQFYWTFKSKFKLEVGLKNMVDCDKYPDIIWFPQGVFILTTCNMNQTTNNYTITINGKDKMCRLNGDLGGNINVSTDFGVLEELDEEGNITYTKLLLKDIIKEILLNQGGELAENIIINDLDEAGLELLEYRYEEPLYLFRRVSDGTVNQLTLDGEMKVLPVGSSQPVSLIDLNSYATTSDLILNTDEAQEVYLADVNESWDMTDTFQIIKYEYGDLAGYRLTDLTYAGELKANIGETIVSVLDKIKKMLGHFEYFYNLDGRFIFQKKKTYISTPWNASEDGENAKELDLITDTAALINLTDAKLTTSFANNPNLLNVKNDFSVWGTYKSISGADIPIHMRYAIDKKPVSYRAFRPVKIIRNSDNAEISYEKTNYDYFYNQGWIDTKTVIKDEIEYTYEYLSHTFNSNEWDWRELIYQMALDYYKCRTDEDFYMRMMENNPWTIPNGRTGYEQYYTDIQGFWRQLYNPNPDPIYEEIQSTEISDMTETIYIEEPYVLLSQDERDKLKNEIELWLLDGSKELSYKPDDVYVILDNNVNGTNKKVIYPFVSTQYCCLTEGQTYYYSKNGKLTETGDTAILNVQPLNALYEKVNGTADTKRLVIDLRFADIINNANIDLYIKDTKRKKINEVIGDLAFVYKGSGSTWIQTMYRWNIADNYGNLSSVGETAEKFTYVKEITSGEYYPHDAQNHACWNKTVFESPDQLLFWFDFLDAEGGELFDKYSVKTIGDRTKAINDTGVKSIYYRDVPNIVFQKSLVDNEYDRQSGYTYIQIPDFYQSLFSVSGRGKSAKERIDELIQEHSYCIEQTSITSVPLYHLEPNTKIVVRDEMSKVNGEYIINKVTVPLTYNGTMNLTANKVVSNIM